jgi:mono/diheme cytochrome c family protein
MRIHLLLMSIVAISAGCVQPAAEIKPQLSAEDLFRLHCSTCHGDGTGNGHVAATLKTRPRNLKHQDWQKSVSNEHILMVIREGGQAAKLSPEMPAFKDKLTAQEMDALLIYLRVIGRSSGMLK